MKSIQSTINESLTSKEYVFEAFGNDDSADAIYKQSLKEPFWKEISDKFPGYNSDSKQTELAAQWLYKQIKAWWPLDGLDDLKKELTDKIRDGIS